MALQLDKHRIAIRERGLLEILDLALLVIRNLGFPLLAAFAVGAVPMLILNHLLLSPILADGFDLEPDAWLEFYAKLTLLVLVEAPLAAAPITRLLGQSMFHEQPTVRDIFNSLRAAAPQLLVFQVWIRGGFVLLGLLPSEPELAGLLFFLGVLVLGAYYIFWPYLNEIILLERNPLFRGPKQSMTTVRRSRVFHSPNIGDLMGRWIGAVSLGGLLTFSLIGSMYFLGSMLSGGWLSANVTGKFLVPVAIWLVMGYMTVVRFLCYLDLRIRREGWEVELAMKAEAAKLARHAA